MDLSRGRWTYIFVLRQTRRRSFHKKRDAAVSRNARCDYFGLQLATAGLADSADAANAMVKKSVTTRAGSRLM
jgi:hypothetical protein